LKSIAYIVIVNFKTADLVAHCLESLLGQKAALNGGKVIIVDNDSNDGSVDQLQAFVELKSWKSWVEILPMPRNGGFAYGCNAGIKRVLSIDQAVHYVMLLNPDTLVRAGAIASLVGFMEANHHVGIAGSQLENSEGTIENSAHRFPSPISELLEGARLGLLSRLFSHHEITPPFNGNVHQCDWVSGSSMIIRRQVFEQIGLLDEIFFLYYEEVDFFFRSAKAGWQTWYVPSAKVMHIEGASTGIKSVKRRPQYWYDSRRRYFLKHYGMLGLISADGLWLIGRFSFVLRRCLGLVKKTYANDPEYFSWDIVSGDARNILAGKALHLDKEKF
jgi:N-acetylglucosaminyl-diphospho-decaprenol L-rhamnosyltransferase